MEITGILKHECASPLEKSFILQVLGRHIRSHFFWQFEHLMGSYLQKIQYRLKHYLPPEGDCEVQIHRSTVGCTKSAAN